MRVIKSKEKRNIWVSISLILFLIFPLTGCWDSNEPDRMVYTQGLGIDYKNGKYTIYIQLINLSMLAKIESGGGIGDQIKAEIGHSSGSSVVEAVQNLNKTVQRPIHWGHLNYIFLTKNALSHNGLQDIVDIVDRFFETHYLMWIYSTNESLPKIMSTDPPINMSTYQSRLSDPKAAFKQFSFIQPMDMREVIIFHNEPPHEIVIPIASRNTTDWQDDKKRRDIGVINGVTVIANNKLKGSIINHDANGIRWMEKNFKRTGLSFQIKENQTIGLTFKKRKVKVIPIIKKGNVQFDIQIKTKAVINNLNTNTPLSEISSEAKKIIKKEVQNTYIKALEFDSDIYRLSNVLYKSDFPIWKKIEKEGKIPLDKNSIRKIDVQVMIVDGGKQRKIPTLK